MTGVPVDPDSPAAPRLPLRGLDRYFLRLGRLGFGGPAALVGYMRRDLVEEQHAIDEDTYNLSLALAQVMPGLLAAQAAIAIGYFEYGVRGATLVGFGLLPAPVFIPLAELAFRP